jgi:arsenate reductase
LALEPAFPRSTGNFAENSNPQPLINAMVANPKLIEHPIVVNGDKAALGRPPENVLAIL